MASPYTEAGTRVYTLAVRTVPGLIGSKERHSPQDASVLFEAYMASALEEGLSNQEAWSIMFNASIHWCHQLVRARAASGDRTALQVVEGMGVVAAGWSP